MSQPALFFVEGEKLLNVAFVFEDDVTGPVDLTQYSAITLRIRRSDGVLLERIATIDNAVAGQAHFTLLDGDLVPGQHQAEIAFATSAGMNDVIPDEFPIAFIVRPKV